MSDKGNRVANEIFYFNFPTRAATGVPTTLAGGYLQCLRDDNPTGTMDGLVLDTDFSQVGFHNVSVSPTGSFYLSGSDYSIVLVSGTVSGVSVIGEEVGYFSIENRYKGADVELINGNALAPIQLALSAQTIVSGVAEAGTLSTTQMTTDLTEATNEHYNGRIIIWTSGVLQNQATDITAYLGSTGRLTYTAVTEAPSASDTFIIV